MPKHVACLISLIVNTLSYINNAGKISTLIEQRGHTATQKGKNTLGNRRIVVHQAIL
jgi:hypothetical protein